MTTIDAGSFPHIVDNVLHQLHLSEQYATLATCRLTCSALRNAIDSRLPRQKVLTPLDPVAPPRKTSLSILRETPLWSSDTEGWRPTSIESVTDLHVEGPLYWPSLSAPVPVLRIFDYHALPPPSGAETLILFPSPAYFAPGGKYDRVVELCYEASRVVINMRYNEVPPDFAFRYAPEAELRNSMYRRIGVLEKRQELVLMFTPTLGLEQTDQAAEVQLLEKWTHSVALAVRHNVALNVVLLAERWDWSWFAQPDDGDLCGIEDEAERLAAAFKKLLMVYLYAATETDPASCIARISFMTTAEYEARIGRRMFQLMRPE